MQKKKKKRLKLQLSGGLKVTINVTAPGSIPGSAPWTDGGFLLLILLKKLIPVENLNSFSVFL